MPTLSKPHAGSKGYYPRKRARKETAGFSTFPHTGAKECKPISFLGYKAGMTHILGRDAYNKSVTFGQEVFIPVTVVEVPPLKVFGIRAYQKTYYGEQPLMDVFAEKTEKELEKKMHSFRKHGKKRTQGKKKDIKHAKKIEDLEKEKHKIVDIKLLVFSQAKEAGLPKKTPDVLEISLSGNIEQKIHFAKEKLGKEISIEDTFKENEYVDARAVTTGKGTQGVVKRFGVKTFRPKAKYTRAVGSIGPWHPNTVMWQVARQGQMGYHSRTEFNKKIMKIGTKPEDIKDINPKSGFKKYGNVKTTFVLISGSLPGPVKRAVSFRIPMRKPKIDHLKIEAIDFIGTSQKESKLIIGAEKQKIKAAEEKKEEKKSVADEIAAAVKGEKK